MISLITQ